MNDFAAEISSPDFPLHGHMLAIDMVNRGNCNLWNVETEARRASLRRGRCMAFPKMASSWVVVSGGHSGNVTVWQVEEEKKDSQTEWLF